MTRPSVIFILIDDMGWRDLACYGSTFYETPNLDRLAREGMLFTDAYASCPVCSPTRASILTGRYPARVGLTNYLTGRERGRLIGSPYVENLPLSEVSIARALKERAGYRTYHVGKWHLGPEPYWPEHHGFDVNVAGCDWGSPKGGYFGPWANPRMAGGRKGEYLVDRLTDEAIRLIESSDGHPFFMYLAHYAVHTPIQAKAETVRYFADKARRLGLDRKDPFVVGDPFPCEHLRRLRITRRVVQSDPAYAAMIKSLDEGVGRLMDTLDRLGIADSTALFFTSDNGGLATSEGSPTCNHPLAEGKGWMYEGGTREPLIVRWPSVVRPGSICREVVTSPDFYPTLLEMAGVEAMPAQHVDGVSLVPLLGGGGDIARRAIFWHYPHYGNQGGTPGSSVRCGDHKLIEFFEDGRLELYNLRDDPSETRNLAADEPAVRDDLHRRLVAWRRDVGARIPEPNPDWAG